MSDKPRILRDFPQLRLRLDVAFGNADLRAPGREAKPEIERATQALHECEPSEGHFDYSEKCRDLLDQFCEENPEIDFCGGNGPRTPSTEVPPPSSRRESHPEERDEGSSLDHIKLPDIDWPNVWRFILSGQFNLWSTETLHLFAGGEAGFTLLDPETVEGAGFYRHERHFGGQLGIDFPQNHYGWFRFLRTLYAAGGVTTIQGDEERHNGPYVAFGLDLLGVQLHEQISVNGGLRFQRSFIDGDVNVDNIDLSPPFNTGDDSNAYMMSLSVSYDLFPGSEREESSDLPPEIEERLRRCEAQSASCAALVEKMRHSILEVPTIHFVFGQPSRKQLQRLQQKGEHFQRINRKPLSVVPLYALAEKDFLDNPRLNQEEKVLDGKFYYDRLEQIAHVLNDPKLGGTKIQITGHTDSVGSDEDNLDLSRRRAEFVRLCLILLGVDGNRLVAVGEGEEKPIVPEENLSRHDRNKARGINRRITFGIIVEN